MKKVLAMFLMTILAFSLCACEEQNAESKPSGEEPEIASEMVNDRSETETNAKFESSERETEAVSEEFEGNETETETESKTASEPKVAEQKTAKLSGLVFCDVTISPTRRTYKIYSIDPDTKRQVDFCLFDISGSYTINGNGTRQMFSEDFTKIAITKSFYKGTSLAQHAGWMTSDGVFHDVVEELNLDPGGDFDKPKNYLAVGFSEDGYFVFRPEKENGTYGYQSVPLNNLTPSAIEDRNALTKSIEPEKDFNNNWYQGTETVTAWIDETHAIVNSCGVTDNSRDSRIANFETKKLEPYIYGDDMSNYSSGRRMCYDAVMSPNDKNEIVFMSCQVPLYEKSDLYSMRLDNRSAQPIKVDLGRQFTMISPYDPKAYTRLIDWK